MNGKIYVIKNKETGKLYIGQTIQDVDKRFKQHLRLCKTNKYQYIYKAISKYGSSAFSYEVLEQGITDYDTLNEREEYYINKFNTIVPNGYNLCPGGNKWRRKPKLDEQQQLTVCRLYEQGKSTRLIANKFNITYTSILNILHKNGVEMRDKTCNLPDRTSVLTKEVMQECYIIKRMRMKDIASLYNVDVSAVNRAKRKYGMKRI